MNSNPRVNVLCFLLSAGIALSSALTAQNAIPAPLQSGPIALIGGTIHPVSGPVIEGGTILFDKGKIVDVGMSVAIPAGADTVLLEGKHVYPGLIDAYNSVGLSEIGLGSPGTVDQAEAGEINPSVRAEVAFHPESELIPVGRSGGVTVAAVTPSGGLISGIASAMMLEGWTWEEMTLKNGVGMVVNWPRMVYTPSPFSRQTKEEWVKARDKSLEDLRTVFENARAYQRARKTAADKGSTLGATDAGLNALVPVLDREMPLIVNASELTQILAATAFAERENVRLIIAGGRDSWRAADILKTKGIPVIISELQSAGRRWEAYDAVFSLPRKLLDAGVTFCIAGDGSGPNIRNLAHHAGHASAFGLPRDEAVKAVTKYPASILGIAGMVGTLEKGKDATLFVSDGDALEISSTVLQVYVQGRKVDMLDKHKRLYRKYEEKYRRMEPETN